MGVSTDAILAFGWDLGELGDLELDWLDEDAEDPIELIERRLLAVLSGFTEEESESSDSGYFERERDAEARSGVEVIWHCSYESPMYFLAARGSEVRAYRGYPESIGELVEDPVWEERLQKAADALGLIGLDSPAWHLFSMWG